MRTIPQTLVFASILLATVVGCKETPPPVNLNNELDCASNPLLQGNRKILVEEFTGVRCVNCPDGSKELQAIVAQTCGKVIPISIHTGTFSIPYNYSTQDLTFANGTDLDRLLGPVNGYPAAIVNRQRFAGNSERPLFVTAWASRVSQELRSPATASLNIGNTYNPATRELSVAVDVLPIGSQTKSVSLSLLILEDSIVSAQVKPRVGIDTFYMHRHVLRQVLPSYRGQSLGLLTGNVRRNFVYTLPAHWIERHCQVVAVLHLDSPTTGEYSVLQAEEKKIIE